MWFTVVVLSLLCRCDPYDPSGFRAWAMSGKCPAIPAMLRLFSNLVNMGFKVILLTGRDEETLGQVTIENLNNQGFVDYERLILRTEAYKGQGAVAYKSAIRKQLVEEGYRIWGNVGDQWSDLHGDYIGNRTFKLPNPMYFVAEKMHAWIMSAVGRYSTNEIKFFHLHDLTRDLVLLKDKRINFLQIVSFCTCW
ncbi:putative Acid phosphatase [Rosa chinensis]|uniref:Putative Acid phosphatase n=1 Tax=Rosa chinensis TaxID=74649 RepID=A0A2P6R8A2_ROSCH|nr:putative Acid phosphatase [Rosa chinensis]